MHSLAMSHPRYAGPGRRPSRPLRTDDELQRCYVTTLQTLAETRARAERAERRLRSRLAQLTWPAVLSGLAGGPPWCWGCGWRASERGCPCLPSRLISAAKRA